MKITVLYIISKMASLSEKEFIRIFEQNLKGNLQVDMQIHQESGRKDMLYILRSIYGLWTQKDYSFLLQQNIPSIYWRLRYSKWLSHLIWTLCESSPCKFCTYLLPKSPNIYLIHAFWTFFIVIHAQSPIFCVVLDWDIVRIYRKDIHFSLVAIFLLVIL